MSQPRFLSAEWRKLILANYAVDPSVLLKYLPAHTELDFFHDRCYVSLVGFMFRNVKVIGLPIPFHINFPEVNLRFYVRVREQGEWRRGVVFISEIVPRLAVSQIANRFFNERYRTMKMDYTNGLSGTDHDIRYRWRYNREWNQLQCIASPDGYQFQHGSEEDFITQHFWGYTALPGNKVAEYQVEHPAWMIYPVTTYGITCNFQALYGKEFGFLANETPVSVMLAEGSRIGVFNKRIL